MRFRENGLWLYNAGLVGLLRILNDKNKEKELEDTGEIKITCKDLKGFEEKYFKYVLLTNIAQLFNFNMPKEQTEDKEIKELKKKFNEKIKKISETKVKYILSIREKKDYETLRIELIKKLEESKKDIIKLVEEIKTTDKKKKIKIEKMKEKKINKIKKDIPNIKSEKFMPLHLQKFYKNKAVVGNYAGENRLLNFKNSYLNPAVNKLETSYKENEIRCKFCNEKGIDTSNLKDFYKIIFSETNFSVLGVPPKDFENFFYNSTPDLFICEICNLIILCAFAGLNLKPYTLSKNEGTDTIFVNLPTLETTYETNNLIYADYKKYSYSENTKSTYDLLLKNLLIESKTKKADWVLENVLTVEIKATDKRSKPIYKILHMGKSNAKLFKDGHVKKSLEFLNGKIKYNKDVERFVLNDVLKLIIEGGPIYPLCELITKEIISKSSNINKYSTNLLHIATIETIKKLKKREGLNLESKQIYGILKEIFEQTKRDFDNLEWKKKTRLAYRLLSLIKAEKRQEFCHNTELLYMSIDKPVPENILGLLNNEDIIEFKSRAYSFMAGFLQKTKVESELNE